MVYYYFLLPQIIIQNLILTPMLKLLYLSAIASLVLFGCTKGEQPDVTPTVVIDNTILLPVAANVYIAGYTIDNSPWARHYAVYWNNGRKILLPNDTLSTANGVALADTNVYMSASGVTGNKITYWKNRRGIRLVDNNIMDPAPKAITTDGKDVYTLGIAYTGSYEKLVPVYWKNEDKAVVITGPYLSDACDITVFGNDIYISGNADFNVFTGYGFVAPCYWKNGSKFLLQSPVPDMYSGLARSIRVTSSDIHIAGSIYQYPGAYVGWGVYWKNGVPLRLSGPTVHSSATSIAVVGNDVYIAGEIDDSNGQGHAAYWKNGVAVILDPIFNSTATGIAIEGNNVHVVGERGIDQIAMYWKNGTAVVLGRGKANAIAISK